MKNRITLSILLAVFLGMFVNLYFRYVTHEDYLVLLAAPCDPEGESCFVSHCDSEEEECTGIEDEDTSYYKELYRNMQDIKVSCQGDLSVCDEDRFFTCLSNESCEIAYCDASDPEVECSE